MKRTEPTLTLILDHDPSQYLCISDKDIHDLNTKLVNGSVWRMDGKQYDIDRQMNYYVFRRLDNVVL